MTSKYLDQSELARKAEFDFDFPADSLKGRTVLVPGGCGGLGAATVALLVRDGAHVVAGYRSDAGRAERLAAKLNAQGPGLVTAIQADITRPEGRQRLLEAAEEAPGGIYGLACFVGDPARVKLEDLDEKALNASLTANFSAPLLLARDVGLRMLERETDGSIVLLSTMQASGEGGVFEGSVNYAAPKAALTHAARILAKQWGPSIRVNVVAPGVNAAGMALQSIKSGKYDRYIDSEIDGKAGIVARFGRPEDVARVVRLLLEPDNYITGQVITVDGGLTLRRG